MVANNIIEAASTVGFDICGIACAHPLDADRIYTEQWLSEGLDGGLAYFHRNLDKRFSPDALLPGAKSVIVCGLNYRNSYSSGYPENFTGGVIGGKIASYALSQDYHKVITGMLHQLAARLDIEHYKITVDTAPNAEKRWAVEAGLGRIGRNKLLITPGFGTFVMLGTLIIADTVDEYAEPLPGNPCGECHRCWEHCPSGSLGEWGMDARRCVSRLTIERNPDPTAEHHGWLFGCDLCQSCCPYNRRPSLLNISPTTLIPIFDPSTISAAEFNTIRPRTAMNR